MSRTNTDFLITLLPSETDRVDELLEEHEALMKRPIQDVHARLNDIERDIGLLLVRALLSG